MSATNQALGTATFTQNGDSVDAEIKVTGVSAGKHGLHLHDVGKCEAPDFTTAGGHWNPTTQMHGDPSAAMHHVGDFGNLEVAADGTGTTKLTTHRTQPARRRSDLPARPRPDLARGDR